MNIKKMKYLKASYELAWLPPCLKEDPRTRRIPKIASSKLVAAEDKIDLPVVKKDNAHQAQAKRSNIVHYNMKKHRTF